MARPTATFIHTLMGAEADALCGAGDRFADQMKDSEVRGVQDARR